MLQYLPALGSRSFHPMQVRLEGVLGDRPRPAVDQHYRIDCQIMTFRRDVTVAVRQTKKHTRIVAGRYRRRQTTGLPKVDTWCTNKYAELMSGTIQLRNVPDALHRTLKACAARAGMSLSDYLLSQIREVAELPTLTELQQRMQRRQHVNLPEPAAAAVRAERDAW